MLIMARWLKEFYKHVGDRRVIVTLDNFKAQATPIAEIAPPPPPVEFVFLPPNATSVSQSLDEGLIHTMKAYHKRHSMTFMAEKYSNDENLLKEVDIPVTLMAG